MTLKCLLFVLHVFWDFVSNKCVINQRSCDHLQCILIMELGSKLNWIGIMILKHTTHFSQYKNNQESEKKMKNLNCIVVMPNSIKATKNWPSSISFHPKYFQLVHTIHILYFKLDMHRSTNRNPFTRYSYDCDQIGHYILLKLFSQNPDNLAT